MDNKNVEVLAPLFDRLIDHEPYVKEEATVLKNYNLAEMRLAVERDISYLLNTRHSRLPHSMYAFNRVLDEDMKLHKYPLLSYGLPDFSKYDVDKLSGQVGIEKDVTRLIEQYEPRLKHIKVFLELSPAPRLDTVLYISGILRCDPTEERFTFPIHTRNLSASNHNTRK